MGFAFTFNNLTFIESLKPSDNRTESFSLWFPSYISGDIISNEIGFFEKLIEAGVKNHKNDLMERIRSITAEADRIGRMGMAGIVNFTLLSDPSFALTDFGGDILTDKQSSRHTEPGVTCPFITSPTITTQEHPLGYSFTWREDNDRIYNADLLACQVKMANVVCTTWSLLERMRCFVTNSHCILLEKSQA